MHFSAKLYFFALTIIPLIVVFLIVMWRDKMKRLALFGDAQSVHRLIPSDTFERQKIKQVVWVGALVCVIIALAGPQFGAKMAEVHRRGIDVIIAVDTSLSMLAEDMMPNRMARAKAELAQLIRNLEGNRIGIIAFAGSSFVQCPLTLDNGAARMFLDFVRVGIIPQQGTEIGTAIRLATKTFASNERKHKALVLLTDGEDHESAPEEAAQEAKKEGVVIFTIGFGNAAGDVIPIKNAHGVVVDYKKDRQGKTIMSRLDPQVLERIAFATGGKYFQATTGALEAETIANDINNLQKKDIKSTMHHQYEERFYYFVFIAFVLLFVEFFLKETISM